MTNGEGKVNPYQPSLFPAQDGSQTGRVEKATHCTPEMKIANVTSWGIFFVVFMVTFPWCLYYPMLACHAVIDWLFDLDQELAVSLSFFMGMIWLGLPVHVLRWAILQLLQASPFKRLPSS